MVQDGTNLKVRYSNIVLTDIPTQHNIVDEVIVHGLIQ